MVLILEGLANSMLVGHPMISIATSFDNYTRPLYVLLLHFRTSVDRELYDLPGFLSLWEVLRSQLTIHFWVCFHICIQPTAQCLTISQITTELDYLSVLDLTIGRNTVPEFENALKTDFGSINDAKSICSSSLLIGQDGISGFYGYNNQ
jgi:hypothetical protein